MTPLKKGVTARQNKSKRGRPRLMVDLKAAEGLGEIGATYDEAARVLGVSVSTFKRRMTEEDGDLRMAFMLGQANGNITLRRKQMDLAMKGHCAMLIWLGKQRLGQTDKGSLEFMGEDGEPLAGRTTILRLPDNGRDTPEPTTIVYLPDNGRGTPDEILAEIEASKHRRTTKH